MGDPNSKMSQSQSTAMFTATTLYSFISYVKIIVRDVMMKKMKRSENFSPIPTIERLMIVTVGVSSYH